MAKELEQQIGKVEISEQKSVFDPDNIDHRNIRRNVDMLIYAIESYGDQDAPHVASLRNQLIGEASQVENGIVIAKEVFQMHMNKKTLINEVDSRIIESRSDRLARNGLHATMTDKLLVVHEPIQIDQENAAS